MTTLQICCYRRLTEFRCHTAPPVGTVLGSTKSDLPEKFAVQAGATSVCETKIELNIARACFSAQARAVFKKRAMNFSLLVR